MTQNDAAKYDFTQQIGYLLRRAYQRHTAIFQQTVPASQLTAAPLCKRIKRMRRFS